MHTVHAEDKAEVAVVLLRAGTHGEVSFESVDSRSSSVYVNVNYSHEHTVNS